MDKKYTLTGGATLQIVVRPESMRDGYMVEATLDCAPVDGENHTHGKNGGTLVNNMDRGQFASRQSSWWHLLYSPQRYCKTASIARRVAQALLVDADERVGAAIARREAKLRMMPNILP